MRSSGVDRAVRLRGSLPLAMLVKPTRWPKDVSGVRARIVSRCDWQKL
jgi:hypothetical protein